MAELSTIARPYADALYAAAPKGGAAAWTPVLERLAQISSHPEVAQALSDPRLSDARRVELLAGMNGAALAAPLTELLKVMVENGRLPALPEVATQYRALVNDAEGVADCLIESAFDMKPDEITALVAALSRKFPQKLKAEVRVNAQLIGGVRVTVGDRVLDGSVRARLEAMQARLTA